MPRELLKTTDLGDKVRAAYSEKDPRKLLDVLRSIYCTLTDCQEIPQEVDAVLRMQLDPSSEGFEAKGFLEDPLKYDLEVPLQEGGDPHLSVFKEGDSIKLSLGGDGITPEIRQKFEELGL